jgi:hypothetical protein
MRLSKLTKELALALEVASIAQAWGNPSPFQDCINDLLVKAGRKPVAPNKACSGLALPSASVKVSHKKSSGKRKGSAKSANH